MASIRRLYIVSLITFLCFTGQAWAAVIVRFEPSDKTVNLNNEPTFTMDIVADIPDPVVGWGLDLTIDNPTIVSQVGSPAAGPLWSSAYAPDGDELAALAFPDSVSGTDILLATITFSANTQGETDLHLSITQGDSSEGFPLDPTGFAEVTFEYAHITVTPEPATLSLLALSGLAVVRRRYAKA